MMAICPAGPPKLMKPSLSQKRKASMKETLAGRVFSAGEMSGMAVSTEGSIELPALGRDTVYPGRIREAEIPMGWMLARGRAGVRAGRFSVVE